MTLFDGDGDGGGGDGVGDDGDGDCDDGDGDCDREPSDDCDREPSDAPPGRDSKISCRARSCRAPLQSSGAFFVAGGTRALSLGAGPLGGRSAGQSCGRRRVTHASAAAGPSSAAPGAGPRAGGTPGWAGGPPVGSRSLGWGGVHVWSEVSRLRLASESEPTIHIPVSRTSLLQVGLPEEWRFPRVRLHSPQQYFSSCLRHEKTI